jgi:uncharacterized repeat protein (TIGR03803 family)
MKHLSILAVACAPLTLVFALLGPAAVPVAQAQTYSVVHSFRGEPDGADPQASLIQDPAGNLYGTTSEGGKTNAGSVFTLNTSGNESVLHSFTQNRHDGSFPEARLAISGTGELYGTTYEGGPADAGAVFQMSRSGSEKVIYSFLGGDDGAALAANVIRDTEGNLYGTTRYGGDLSCDNGNGCGMVFKLDPTGQLTVLYRFTGGSDGAEPLGGLLRDNANNLYGTTLYGGDVTACTSTPPGCGVVFKVDQYGNESVLHSFTGGTDGGGPMAGLVWDTIGGNLFGTTASGGANLLGNVFKMDTSGNETVLYNFKGGSDGAYPYASLIRDSAGNLVGTTNQGGRPGCSGYKAGCGVVFKINSSGHESILYKFKGAGDGGFPVAAVLQDSKGNIYGTASAGGNFKSCEAGCGVVFKITPF